MTTTTMKTTIRRRSNSGGCSGSASRTLLLLSVAWFCYASVARIRCSARAGEIVGTSEWQRVGPNDTLPAGLHVRMDLSGGGTWAKLVDDDDDDGDDDKLAHAEGGVAVARAEMSSDGALIIVDEESPGSSSANGRSNDSGSGNGREDEDETPLNPNKDYVMMHRVISSLPDEEIQRVGGLPALPSANHSTPEITPAERAAFERRMEEIWTARQAELAAFQEENMAEMPKVLQGWIATLNEYVENPRQNLQELLRSERDEDGYDYEDEDGAGDDGEGGGSGVLVALRELEFQLSDLDMARDFHTLGGWPVLLSSLSDDVHRAPSRDRAPNNDGDDEISKERILAKIDEIQSLAAMCAGGAAGNVGEFRGWATEDVGDFVRARGSDRPPSSSAERRPITAVTLLVDALAADLDRRLPFGGGNSTPIGPPPPTRLTFKLRAVFALGRFLRGNPTAQSHFASDVVDGPSVLVRDALGSLAGEAVTTANDWKFASKVLALGTDVVTEILLGEDDDGEADEDGSGAGESSSPPSDAVAEMASIVASLTSPLWCDLALRLMSAPASTPGWIGLRERALSSVGTFAPRCREVSDDEGWGVRDVEQARREWNREGSGDGLDPEYRRELLELVDGALKAMGGGGRPQQR